jgi:protein TonB
LSLALQQAGSPIQAIGLSRFRAACLAMATAAVVCLHAGVLFLRLGVSASSQPSGAPAMAVRWLPSRVVDVAAPREPDVVASPAPHGDREAVSSSKVVAKGAIESQPAMHRAERVAMPAESAAASRSRVEPSNAALVPKPDYLSGGRLDPGPRPLADIAPEYPESANLQEGKVVLRVLISESGVVDEVAVVRAEPKGLFEDAALEAFRAARFSPGMVSGTPVKSQINRGARISGRMY